jgi:hypothetical protein
VPRERHQGHAGQEEQHAADEDRHGLVREGEALLEVGLPRGRLAAQVADGVDRGREKERARDREEQEAEGVDAEPAPPRAGARRASDRGDRQRVRGGSAEQQPLVHAARADRQGDAACENRREHQGADHGPLPSRGRSWREVRRSTSM